MAKSEGNIETHLRFDRLERRGLWKRLWHQRFQNIDDNPFHKTFIDSTLAPAHQNASYTNATMPDKLHFDYAYIME